MCRPALPSGEVSPAPQLQKEDEWIETFDVQKFTEEIQALGDKLEKQQGDADVAHLQKMVLWSNLCGIVGLLTMGICVNPVSVFLLSCFTFSRWTMIAHHTCHGGYDKLHPNKRWNRFRFGVGSGWRRFCDWLDWMMPEAWNVEHNNRHHYNLSEVEDPDLVEENLSDIREMDVPLFVKYMAIPFVMVTWKWFYYAPNTYKEFKLAMLRRKGTPIPEGVKPQEAVTVRVLLTSGTVFFSLWEFLTVVIGPYFLFRFIVTPAPLFLLGPYLGMPYMYSNAVKSLVLSELLTNAHAFLMVVTNHAGDDMYRFGSSCRPFSGSFFMRQVGASVDYAYGTDLIDFLHGYLNYQIEHHLWPALSMKSYQKAAPLVKEICQRHGIPYVQQGCFKRLKKTIDIMTGTTSMRVFPKEYERKYLELDAIAEAKKYKKKN